MKWENDPLHWPISEQIGPFSKTQIMDFIENSADLYAQGQIRRMIIDEEDEILGAIDVFEFEPSSKSAGIGIMIAEVKDRRKGFAKDALLSLVQHYREEKRLKLLKCLIHFDNEGSMALFENCGFTATGTKMFKGKKALQFILEL